MNDAKRVLIGIPEELGHSILWVGREFRTNPLSHEPGGSDVIVEYHNGEVLGYDWIKFPSKYISKIYVRSISDEHENFETMDRTQQLEIVNKDIRRIFARKYSRETISTEPFKLAWTSKEETFDMPMVALPWEALKEFDNK